MCLIFFLRFWPPPGTRLGLIFCVCCACFFSFTADDAKDLSALCSHISVALENIKRADEADEVRSRPLPVLFGVEIETLDEPCKRVRSMRR